MAQLFPSATDAQIYPYTDEDGGLLFEIVRRTPKGFYARQPDSEGGWINNIHGVRKVLFRLPAIIGAVEEGRRIWIVEGEKDVLALEDLQEVATCNPLGASKWRSEFNSVFRGADVTIVMDRDSMGTKHGLSVRRQLFDVTKSVEVVRPAEGCQDMTEHIGAGYDLEADLQSVHFEAESGSAAEDPPAEDGSTGKPQGQKIATQLIELARESGELFHSSDVAFLEMTRDGIKRTLPIQSRLFRTWLRSAYWQRQQSSFSQSCFADAAALLEAEAIHSGVEKPVFVRIASGPDGCIYVDLADDLCRSVKISRGGWEVVSDVPVNFVRKAGMLPLPVPKSGGSLNDLRPFLNVTDEGFTLLMAWIIGCYCPWGPYAVLQMRGEQGSSKTTMGELVRMLTDPHEAGLRDLPRDRRDLAIAAQNIWVMGFDNVSWIPPAVSDALCMLSTGAAFTTRQLYTDDSEMIFKACRPIFLNGIEEVGTRNDLLDRTLFITLPTITGESRRDKKSLLSEFEAARPYLFGSLMDAVSLALKEHEGTKIDSLERMADFVRWAGSAAPSFGGLENLQRALRRNRATLNELSLEATPAISAIIELLDDRGSWSGNAKQLLEELTNRRMVSGNRENPVSALPKSPKAMGGLLRRQAPTLRESGIDIQFKERGRIWEMRKEE